VDSRRDFSECPLQSSLDLFDDRMGGNMIPPEFVEVVQIHFLITDAEEKFGDGESGWRLDLVAAIKVDFVRR
jgi:hypothetical protein